LILLYKHGMLRNMQEDQNANTRVGRAVARYRGSRMSQADLARELAARLGKPKIDPTTITRIESGKRTISVDELEAFADIFNVYVNDLLVDADLGGRLADLRIAVNDLGRISRDERMASSRLWNAAEEVRMKLFDLKFRDEELVEQVDAEELSTIRNELLRVQQQINEPRMFWPSGLNDDGSTFPVNLDGTAT
jgi:transcriptional regulator with XRE-family HTH domain